MSISLCLTNKNRGHLLQYFLKSCTTQTDKDFQIVIADDMSTDNSLEIINSFRAKLNIKHIIFDSKKHIRQPVIAMWVLGNNIFIRNSDYDIMFWTNPEMILDFRAVEIAKQLYHKQRMVVGVCPFLNPQQTRNLYERFEKDNWKFDKDVFDTQFRKENGFYYQHPDFHKRFLYFIGVCSKQAFLNINGVDEEFALGTHYEDDNNVLRLQASGIEWEWSYDLYSAHCYHEPMNSWVGKLTNFESAVSKNKSYFDQTKDFINPNNYKANLTHEWGNKDLIIEILE